MARYMRWGSAAFALALAGCNLGHSDEIYNQTSCPIGVKYSHLGWNAKNTEPTIVKPGEGIFLLVPHREQRFDDITVIDHNNVEHRYDAAALAALRPHGASNEYWGYTDSGLAYLRDDPKQGDLDKLAAQPCGELQNIQPAIS